MNAKQAKRLRYEIRHFANRNDVDFKRAYKEAKKMYNEGLITL